MGKSIVENASVETNEAEKKKNGHAIPKVAFLWLAPICLIIIYDFATLLLRYFHYRHIPLPLPSTVTSVTAFGILASPLWVLAGYSFTYLFGGLGITYVIQLFSHNKLLRRKIVIQPNEDLEKISSSNKDDNKNRESIAEYLSPKSFSLTLGLVLGLNLAYTLLIIRYFQNFFALPKKVLIYQYFLSYRFLSIEFALALLFLPLLAIVMPIMIGKIRVRQIDSSPLQNYWLSYVYSAAGGASAVLLLLTVFERFSATTELIISSLFVFGIISWYTAIGIDLAIPRAQRMLASKLLKIREDGKKENIIFGKIFVGPYLGDVKEV
jgi:hypothetical protein